jgi:hypothetical protein
MKVLKRINEGCSFFQQLVTTTALRGIDGARYRKDLTALVQRQVCGQKGSASNWRFDYQYPFDQAGNETITTGKMVFEWRCPRRMLRYQTPSPLNPTP